jgi:hypothetical protein
VLPRRVEVTLPDREPREPAVGVQAPEIAAPAQRRRQHVGGARPVAGAQQRLGRVGGEHVADPTLDAQPPGECQAVPGHPRRFGQPAHGVERVGQEHVGPGLVGRVDHVAGALARRDEVRQTLVDLTEIAQVDRADVVRPQRCRRVTAGGDGLLTRRAGLGVTGGEHQRVAVRGQYPHPVRRRLVGHEVDGPRERREAAVAVTGRQQVGAEPLVQQGRADRIRLFVEQAERPPDVRRRPRAVAGQVGQFGGPAEHRGKRHTGARGRVGHARPQGERRLQMRERLRAPRHHLGFPSGGHRCGQRLDRTFRGGPVRGQFGRAGPPVGERPGQPRVQVFAFTRDQRRVDGLREQRVPEPERAGGLVGDQYIAVDRFPQGDSELVFRHRHDRGEQAVRDVPASGRGDLQRRATVGAQGGDPVQERVPQERRECLLAGGRQFLGEERVPAGPLGDGMRQRGFGDVRQQPGHVVVPERSEVHRARAARPDQAAHQAWQRLVVAVRGHDQDAVAGDAVGEVGHEVERRRVGPVQVFDDEHERCVGGLPGEQTAYLLEEPRLLDRPVIARRPAGEARQLGGAGASQRPDRLQQSEVRQAGADQVDAVPGQHGGAGAAGPLGELGHQPALADAGLATHEHRATLAGGGRRERRLKAVQLSGAPDEAAVRRCAARRVVGGQHADIVPPPADGT